MGVPVVLVALDTYDVKQVTAALRRGLDMLDPQGKLFYGDDVLVKPNLLAPADSESGVCTHPAMMAALVDLALERGAAQVRAGDSPAVHSASAVAGAAGVSEVLNSRGMPIEDFSDIRWAQFPQGQVCRRFPLARQVLRADALISAARLKTHNLTRYTGATKNLYGCIVGTHKAQMHLRYHRIEEFSRMLADLALLLQPALCLVDGVVSMEGPGPRSGDLRRTGFVVMARDPITADALACRLVGLSAADVLHLRYGAESGLGVLSLEDMCIVGADPEKLRVQKFRVPTGRSATTWRIPRALVDLGRRLFVPKPRVLPQRCTGCGQCAEICPASVITPGRPVEISLRDCISCYCCHEVCPHQAIELRRLGIF